MPEISPEQVQEYMNSAIELTVAYVPRLLLAILVLIIGLWLIRRVTRVIGVALSKSGTDEALTDFLQSISSVGLKVLLLVSVASMVGIATTSFVAVLGAAGLAVGLALQGSLSNFAGGVLILLFKPFRIGDFIEAQGVSGTVSEVQIFHTLINTPDNKVVIIPNGSLSNNVITNFSREERRRIDLVFGVGYEDDIDAARRLILEQIRADDRIHAEPEPLIAVSELADSSVNLTVRVWVNAGDLWGVRFGLLESVKASFDAHGISIPYPQRDLHIHNSQNEPSAA